jgi:hypothetical protein
LNLRPLLVEIRQVPLANTLIDLEPLLCKILLAWPKGAMQKQFAAPVEQITLARVSGAAASNSIFRGHKLSLSFFQLPQKVAEFRGVLLL